MSRPLSPFTIRALNDNPESLSIRLLGTTVHLLLEETSKPGGRAGENSTRSGAEAIRDSYESGAQAILDSFDSRPTGETICSFLIDYEIFNSESDRSGNGIKPPTVRTFPRGKSGEHFSSLVDIRQMKDGKIRLPTGKRSVEGMISTFEIFLIAQENKLRRALGDSEVHKKTN